MNVKECLIEKEKEKAVGGGEQSHYIDRRYSLQGCMTDNSEAKKHMDP